MCALTTSEKSELLGQHIGIRVESTSNPAETTWKAEVSSVPCRAVLCRAKTAAAASDLFLVCSQNEVTLSDKAQLGHRL